MSAYVISELDVRDPVAIETYRTIAANSIAQYGGRYLVRNGAASVAEGEPRNFRRWKDCAGAAADFCGRRGGVRGGPSLRGAKRRSNPELCRDSELLRFARNDDSRDRKSQGGKAKACPPFQTKIWQWWARRKCAFAHPTSS
jgi:hypothetical protein